VGGLIKQGGEDTGTHHQACRHLWISGHLNSLLGINRGEGNTKNTIFYHLLIRNVVTVAGEVDHSTGLPRHPTMFQR